MIWNRNCSIFFDPSLPFYALSPPRKLNTKKSGRSSGGILVAVKRSLTPYFSLITQTSDYIWVKIDKNILQLDKDVYVHVIFHQVIHLISTPILFQI